MQMKVRVACMRQAEIDPSTNELTPVGRRRVDESTFTNFANSEFMFVLAVCDEQPASVVTARAVLSNLNTADDIIRVNEAVGYDWASRFATSLHQLRYLREHDTRERRSAESGDCPSLLMNYCKGDIVRAQVVLGRVLGFMMATASQYAREDRTIDILFVADGPAAELPAMLLHPYFRPLRRADVVLYTIEVDGHGCSRLLGAEYRPAPPDAQRS